MFNFRLRLAGLGLAFFSLVGELWRVSLPGWKSHSERQGSGGKAVQTERQTGTGVGDLEPGQGPTVLPATWLFSEITGGLTKGKWVEAPRTLVSKHVHPIVSWLACVFLSSTLLCLPPGLLPCSNPETCVIQACLTWTDPCPRGLWRGN